MSGLAPYGTAHPQCQDSRGHVCQRPSGRECTEQGCDNPAGTLWGPMWCPEHDEQRLNRVTASMKRLASELTR